MCGIAGLLRLARGQDVSADRVQRMCDVMQHRGPDDAGVFVDSGCTVGLGHRRLSIVDLGAAGHGPMPNADGSLWITYNGEVYNHREIRCGLEARGYRYRSQTDTETLLYLYQETGPDMLAQLRGMFAFALYDARRRRVFLARDRLGIKPLYYT